MLDPVQVATVPSFSIHGRTADLRRGVHGRFRWVEWRVGNPAPLRSSTKTSPLRCVRGSSQVQSYPRRCRYPPCC